MSIAAKSIVFVGAVALAQLGIHYEIELLAIFGGALAGVMGADMCIELIRKLDQV